VSVHPIPPCQTAVEAAGQQGGRLSRYGHSYVIMAKMYIWPVELSQSSADD